MSSFSTLTPLVVKADTAAIPVNKDNVTISDAEQLLQASARASLERSIDVSDFMSPYEHKDKVDNDQRKLVRKLTSPLVVEEISPGITEGNPDPTGTYFLRANAAYMIQSYDNSNGLIYRATITIHRVSDGSLATKDVENFGLSRRSVPDYGTQKTIKPGGKKITNGTNELTNASNDNKSVDLAVHTFTPVGSNGGKLTPEFYPNGTSGDTAVRVTAKMKNSDNSGTTTAEIRILYAQTRSNRFSGEVYFDKLVKFNVDKILREQIVKDAVRNARSQQGSKVTDGKVRIIWHAWYITYEGKKQVAKEDDIPVEKIAYEYDVNSSAASDDFSKINQDAFNFEYLVYRTTGELNGYNQPYNQTTAIHFFPEIIMKYTDPKGKNPDRYRTVIPKTLIAPTIYPDSDHIPEVTMKNYLYNKTDSSKDETISEDPDVEAANYKVNDTVAGDKIKFKSEIHETYDYYYGNGMITDGVYETQIPRGMTVSDVEMVSDTGIDPVIDPDKVEVTDDPDDDKQSILKITDIYLDDNPTFSGEMNYELTFIGTAPSDFYDNFSFQPTFDGVGGVDPDKENVPVEQAVGDVNEMTFTDEIVEPDGEIHLEPMDIHFGTINALSNERFIKHRETPNDEDILKITDKRAVKKAAQISIKADSLKKEGDDPIEFPGSLMFHDSIGNNQVVEGNNPIVIYESQEGEELSNIFWKKDEGLLLHVHKKKVIQHGKYSTKVSWTATDSL